MKVRKYSNTEERTVLMAMIASDAVLGRIATKLKGEDEPFKSRWSNLIAGWCLSHFEKYAKAPRKSIQTLFARWAESAKDDETSDLIESFLSGLSSDYAGLAEEMNEEYTINIASNFFERVRLERLSETIQESVERNDLVAARDAYASFEPIDFSSTSWVDPFDKNEIFEAFRVEDKDRPLIRYADEAIDRFLSRSMVRTGFVSFVGPEKRGKSFWLLEHAWQAFKQNQRVMVYGIGDMSSEEYKKRLYSRITFLPDAKDAGVLSIPVEVQPPLKKEDKVKVLFEKKDKHALSIGSMQKVVKRLESLNRSGQTRMKMKFVGADTITAGDVEQDVKDFAKEGWVPDVLVLDYADLLSPEASTRRQDYRHQVNASWKILRRIALDFNLLVITATQAASSSYDTYLIKKKDFSEDKRKNAHVTDMIGINQTPDEKEMGVYRLNHVFVRGQKWTDTQCVWTAGNLAISNPCMVSAFAKKGD